MISEYTGGKPRNYHEIVLTQICPQATSGTRRGSFQAENWIKKGWLSRSFLFYFTTKNKQWWNPTMQFRVNMFHNTASPLAQNFVWKVIFFLLIRVSPLSIGPTFPKVWKILAHICQIKWNLISFDD